MSRLRTALGRERRREAIAAPTKRTHARAARAHTHADRRAAPTLNHGAPSTANAACTSERATAAASRSIAQQTYAASTTESSTVFVLNALGRVVWIDVVSAECFERCALPGGCAWRARGAAVAACAGSTRAGNRAQRYARPPPHAKRTAVEERHRQKRRERRDDAEHRAARDGVLRAAPPRRRREVRERAPRARRDERRRLQHEAREEPHADGVERVAREQVDGAAAGVHQRLARDGGAHDGEARELVQEGVDQVEARRKDRRARAAVGVLFCCWWWWDEEGGRIG